MNVQTQSPIFQRAHAAYRAALRDDYSPSEGWQEETKALAAFAEVYEKPLVAIWFKVAVFCVFGGAALGAVLVALVWSLAS